MTIQNKGNGDMSNKEKNTPNPHESEETITEVLESPEVLDTEQSSEDIVKSQEEPDLKSIEALEKKAKDAEDKYLRLLAEFDNYRKRTDREKCETFSNATSKCICDFLPVIDNFERALQSECADENYKNGIKLILNQITELLKKMDVSEIEALGEPFDPNLHNAVKQIEAEGFEANTVCEVLQKGYMMGDKVIRYAFVVVAE